MQEFKDGTLGRKVELHFAYNPKDDTVFVTSDGRLFPIRVSAANYSGSLTNKTVVAYKRHSYKLQLEADLITAPPKTSDKNQAPPEPEVGNDGEGIQAPLSPDPTQEAQDSGASENTEENEANEELEGLKEMYKSLTKKGAHHTWDADKISEKIKEFEAGLPKVADAKADTVKFLQDHDIAFDEGDTEDVLCDRAKTWFESITKTQ